MPPNTAAAAQSSSNRAGNRSGRRRLSRFLFRWISFAVLAFLVLSVAPVLLMRWVDPFTSAFMLQARVEAFTSGERGYRTQYRWVDWDKISPHAAMAVIAAEDQRFPVHWGFDLKSIRDAVEDGNRGKRLRGASTISQQVAKNLFLWSGRSYVRKGLEAWFTVLIETLWPKQRILEVYLNIAEFGHGVYGIEAASRKFIGRSAARLSRTEAALLAAVLPNPVRLRADRPSRYVRSRRDWILGQMSGLGGPAYLKTLDSAQKTL